MQDYAEETSRMYALGQYVFFLHKAPKLKFLIFRPIKTFGVQIHALWSISLVQFVLLLILLQRL